MDDFSDLEALLKSAKREAYSRRERSERHKALAPKIAIRRQADLEWTVGKTVCLIHKGEDGKETALGLFIEHLRNGSRWLRPTADSLSPDHTEIVTGSWWLHPSIREIPVDSTHEVIAIRARFEMLIKEFEDEYRLPPILLAERNIEDEEEFDDEEEFEDEEFEDDEWDGDEDREEEEDDE